MISRLPAIRIWAPVCAAAVVLAGPGHAAAQAPPAAPDPATAAVALSQAQQAFEPAHEQAPGLAVSGAGAPDASAALLQLAAAIPALGSHDRQLARGLLSRPTDGPADRYGDGYPAGAPVASVAGAHFCVFWVDDPARADAPDLTDADGDSIPDYVEAILGIAEHSYAVEVTPGALGWAPPKPDAAGCGSDPGARADIYLKQLGNQGLFGYESPDPDQGQVRSQYGYLTIDDDYAQAEYGYADPLLPAEVTIAHEFNHLLQQGYDSFQDLWMFESTAVWSEERVYPEINDYVNYLRSFARRPEAPITDPGAGAGLRIYGSAVWNHWLDRGAGLGADSIRRAWEVSGLTRPADFAVAAYDRAIRGRGGGGFSQELARFAAATAEWRTGHGGFPDAPLYPDVKRKGALRPGSHRRVVLDHTAYRLLDVRGSGRKPIELSLRAPRGLRAGIALVARAGGPTSGRVRERTRFLRRGGRGSVSLDRPRRFDRITAVVVNADGRVRGFRGTDWVYRKDGARCSVRLSG